MPSPASIEATLPESGQDKRGQDASPSLPRIIAIAESFKRRRDDRPEAAKLDKLVAPWFDRACTIYIAIKGVKASELAERMGLPDEQYLSHMRAGRKSIAMRHRIPLLDCPEAVVALQEMECAEAGIKPPEVAEPIVITEQDLKDGAYECMTASEELRFTLAHRVAKRKGCRPEFVLKLLSK